MTKNEKNSNTAENKTLLYFNLSATVTAAEIVQTLKTPNITPNNPLYKTLSGAAAAVAGVEVEHRL